MLRRAAWLIDTLEKTLEQSAQMGKKGLPPERFKDLEKSFKEIEKAMKRAKGKKEDWDDHGKGKDHGKDKDHKERDEQERDHKEKERKEREKKERELKAKEQNGKEFRIKDNNTPKGLPRVVVEPGRSLERRVDKVRQARPDPFSRLDDGPARHLL